MKHDLVDAFTLMIFPVTLGGEKRLFADGTIQAAFKVTESTVVSQFESQDWEADLWSLVTSTMRRTGSFQPHLRVTSARAILKNVGGRFTAWQNLSTD